MHYTEAQIQACLDGTLPGAEAQAVREHCRTCERCERIREEIRAVWAVLGAAPEPQLAEPIWPHVRTRLAPRWGLSWAMGASAAALAGVMLGLLLGVDGEPAGEPEASSWADVGSLIADGGGATLDAIYLGIDEEGGEVQ